MNNEEWQIKELEKRVHKLERRQTLWSRLFHRRLKPDRTVLMPKDGMTDIGVEEADEMYKLMSRGISFHDAEIQVKDKWRK